MNLALIAISFVALLALGYSIYGAWIARQFGLDDGRPTPAELRSDGVDFVPTRPFYLFGQHFSAIAAAGPIAGPILACQSFGWLPCLLWIGLGVVLIGAVHDLSSLAASVRHGALSIAEITREQLGSRAGRAVMAFIWVALVYVIIAFTDITAGTFVAGADEMKDSLGDFNPGGAVAAASAMYLGLAVAMGLVQRWLNPPLWLLTAIFVPATFGSAWLGTHVSTAFVLDHRMWGMLILLYCIVASVIPVQYLLQPRGYLGGFVLYSALFVGVAGVLFGGYEIQQPAFKTWHAAGAAGALFPFLFVTIACGACSGFHGLVCSGTTSKQIARESHIRPVGYGAMLAEGFVALIALATVMIAASAELENRTPGTVYGNGIGRFMTLFVGGENLRFAVTFGAMAFSTFVFDTIDVSARLGRLLVQELTGLKGRTGAVLGALATVSVPLLVVATASKNAWTGFWLLFGASNQLLAALTLLAITVWLARSRRRPLFTLLPMLFVLTITLWALTALVRQNLASTEGLDTAAMNALAGVVLVGLAGFLVAVGFKRLTEAVSERRTMNDE